MEREALDILYEPCERSGYSYRSQTTSDNIKKDVETLSQRLQ